MSKKPRFGSLLARLPGVADGVVAATMVALLVVITAAPSSRAAPFSFTVLRGEVSVETHGWTPLGGSYLGSAEVSNLLDVGIFNANLAATLEGQYNSGLANAVARKHTLLDVEPSVFPGEVVGLHFDGEGGASADAAAWGDYGNSITAQAVADIQLRLFLYEPVPFTFSAAVQHEESYGGGGGVHLRFDGYNFATQETDLLAFLGDAGVQTGPDSTSLSGVLAPGAYLLQIYLHSAAQAGVSAQAVPSAFETASFQFDLSVGTLASTQGAAVVPEAGSSIAMLGLMIGAVRVLRQRAVSRGACASGE